MRRFLVRTRIVFLVNGLVLTLATVAMGQNVTVDLLPVGATCHADGSLLLHVDTQEISPQMSNDQPTRADVGPQGSLNDANGSVSGTITAEASAGPAFPTDGSTIKGLNPSADFLVMMSGNGSHFWQYSANSTVNASVRVLATSGVSNYRAYSTVSASASQLMPTGATASANDGLGNSVLVNINGVYSTSVDATGTTYENYDPYGTGATVTGEATVSPQQQIDANVTLSTGPYGGADSQSDTATGMVDVHVEAW